MEAIVFDVRINSLYSIRIPFTWQSALTYPVLPPSAVIGLFANALQRYKNNKPPLEYLDVIEENLLWAASRLLTPCVVKSYITSAIVKWEDKLGGKFTNALGRQFAYSKKLQIAAIFKNHTLVDVIAEALKSVPLTCGDSESPIAIEDVFKVKNVYRNREDLVKTFFPFPITNNTDIINGSGITYLMHKRCRKTNGTFPLSSFIVPIRKENGILLPSILTIKTLGEKGVMRIQGVGDIIL